MAEQRVTNYTWMKWKIVDVETEMLLMPDGDLKERLRAALLDAMTAATLAENEADREA